MNRRGMEGMQFARILAPCLALAALGICGWASLGPHGGAARGSVELFSWSRWNKQQESLISQTNALTSSLSHLKGAGAPGLADQGRAIKRGLRSMTRMMKPQRAAAATRGGAPKKHYRTMSQELSILKVQKQMRTEAKFPKDRIHGAGDVVGQLGEQDEADLRNALFLPTPSGPNTNTQNLFENCEDGSLTVEDAELCGRRASAIKQLTQNTIMQQIAMNPPQDPALVRRAGKEDTARSNLIADAMIGKEYLNRLRQEKKRVAGLTGELQRKVRGAGLRYSRLSEKAESPPARRQQLENKYALVPPSLDRRKCTCDSPGAVADDADEEGSSAEPAPQEIVDDWADKAENGMTRTGPESGPATEEAPGGKCVCFGPFETKTVGSPYGGPLDFGGKGAWPAGLKPESKVRPEPGTLSPEL